jgi:hypothetical protein
MLAVDPKNFDKLDRRSTMLMAASRNQAEDVEKNEITAMEERKSNRLRGALISMLISPHPTAGMDALRGGFGTVGSIIRARSARRLSNASTLPGRPIQTRMASTNSYSMPWQQSHLAPADMPRYSREP